MSRLKKDAALHTDLIIDRRAFFAHGNGQNLLQKP